MKVALMYNLNRGQCDEELEFDRPGTIDELVRVLSLRYNVLPIECHRNVPVWLSQLQRFGPDLIFSVAEGYPGCAREAYYPALYEQLGIPYTGSDPTAMLLSQNKALCKQIAVEADVVTPDWTVMADEADLQEARDLAYPVLVKPNSEGSSLGIDAGAVVWDPEALIRRVRYVWKRFRNLALVEQYIPNSMDLSISYVEGLGPEIFGPVTYATDGSDLYDFDWKRRSYLYPNLVQQPSTLSPEQAASIRDAFRRMIRALDIRGYARADFRLGPDGVCYFLEMNAQVEMAEKAEFAVPVLQAGYSFEDLILHIAHTAWQERRRLPGAAGLRRARSVRAARGGDRVW